MNIQHTTTLRLKDEFNTYGVGDSLTNEYKKRYGVNCRTKIIFAKPRHFYRFEYFIQGKFGGVKLKEEVRESYNFLAVLKNHKNMSHKFNGPVIAQRRKKHEKSSKQKSSKK
jgi:ribosomal protein S13